ncbi:hypothetical protein [Leptospira levettii]|uniref:hypothetical protein n=1 Tax=Leptospira levettii TaxID=2023178 RepID=UPI00223E8039|nr:hypothetical protein [Leptospira levettii]
MAILLKKEIRIDWVSPHTIRNLPEDLQKLESETGEIAVNYWIIGAGTKNDKVTRLKKGTVSINTLTRSILIGTHLKIEDFDSAITDKPAD